MLTEWSAFECIEGPDYTQITEAGSWIYSYMCNWCLSALKFEYRSWRSVLDTTLCDKVCQ